MEVLDNKQLVVKSDYGFGSTKYTDFTEISEAEYHELIAKHKEAGTLVETSRY